MQKEKSCTSPILDDGMKWANAAKDRWNEKQTPSILEAKIKGTMDHQRIDGVRNKSVSKKREEKEE